MHDKTDEWDFQHAKRRVIIQTESGFVARDIIPRYGLVRMELIGEPTVSPDGQSIQLARFPWQRPTDASHGISLNDIVRVELRQTTETPTADAEGAS